VENNFDVLMKNLSRDEMADLISSSQYRCDCCVEEPELCSGECYVGVFTWLGLRLGRRKKCK